MRGGYEYGERNFEERRLHELYMANTWFEKEEQRKIAYSMGENKTEDDFLLVCKSNRKYLKRHESNFLRITTLAGGNGINERELKKVERTNRLLEGEFGS